MNMTNVFVHVGLPKAASTTLQKHLFNRYDTMLNLGVYPVNNIGQDSVGIDRSACYLKDSRIKEFYSHLLCDDELSFDYQKAVNDLHNIIESHLSSNHKSVVFSDEKITSTFFSHNDLFLKGRRLKKLFPSAKIIFVLRDQLEWLKSQYRDQPFDPRCLDIGRPVSFSKWIEISSWSDEVNVFSMLRYNELVGAYEKLFGQDNVCVLLFEEMVNDLPGFCQQLSSFMGIDYDKTLALLTGKNENMGVSRNYNRFRAFKRKCFLCGLTGNVIFDSVLDMMEPLFRSDNKQLIALTGSQHKRLSELFSKSNTLLNNRKRLGMRKYGYSLLEEAL